MQKTEVKEVTASALTEAPAGSADRAYLEAAAKLAAAKYALSRSEWRAWQGAAAALLTQPARMVPVKLAFAACELGLPAMYKAASLLTEDQGAPANGGDCLAIAAAAGQTRMIEFVCERMTAAERDQAIDDDDYANAITCAAEHGHTSTVARMLKFVHDWTRDGEPPLLGDALSAAYAFEDIKTTELLAAHATVAERKGALPAAYSTGSAAVVAAAHRLCGDAKLSPCEAGLCAHAAAYAGHEDDVWKVLEKHEAEPTYAAIGAARGGHKALCLRMVELCGGVPPVGTLHGATAARVAAEREAERLALVEALCALGADAAPSPQYPTCFKPEKPETSYPPNVAALAVELALAEMGCARAEKSYEGQMTAAQCWNAVLRATAAEPGATPALAYAGLRGGNAWDDVLALATELGAQANAEYARLRGATTLGALLRAAALGRVAALRRLGETDIAPAAWSLAGHIAAQSTHTLARDYCNVAFADTLLGVVRPRAISAAAPRAAAPDAIAPETSASPSAQIPEIKVAHNATVVEIKAPEPTVAPHAHAEVKAPEPTVAARAEAPLPTSTGALHEPAVQAGDEAIAGSVETSWEQDVAALAKAAGQINFPRVHEAFAVFKAKRPLAPDAAVLAEALDLACAAGDTTAALHLLLLGAPLTYHSLILADRAQHSEVCEMLLRFNIKVPRRHVASLSRSTQEKLYPSIHIVPDS